MSASSSIAAWKKIVQQLRLEAGINRVKVNVGSRFVCLDVCLSLFFLFTACFFLSSPDAFPFYSKKPSSRCHGSSFPTLQFFFLSFSTGVPGRGGPAAVLPPARRAGPLAHRHVLQQQPLQTAEGLLLPIASPTSVSIPPCSCSAHTQHLLSVITSTPPFSNSGGGQKPHIHHFP